MIYKFSAKLNWGSIPISSREIGLLDRLFIIASLSSVLLLAFPHMAAAEARPLVFEINNLTEHSGLQKNYLAKFLAADVPVELPDSRIELLKQYLASKNSPMASEAESLLKQYHFRLIVGISFAESNFCKTQIRPNNCWGIGGSYPETYQTLENGIVRADKLIQKYHDLGMTTPKLMRSTWVGWQNDSWIVAVNQITKEMESLGL